MSYTTGRILISLESIIREIFSWTCLRMMIVLITMGLLWSGLKEYLQKQSVKYLPK